MKYYPPVDKQKS